MDRKFGILNSGTELVSIGNFLFMLTQDSFRATSPIRNESKVGRNQSCPCGSNRKYKNCCGGK